MSDHRPLTICLKLKTNIDKIQKYPQTNPSDLTKRPHKIKIENNIKTYKDELNHVMNTNYINMLITKIDNISNIDELNNITKSVTALYKDAANKTTINNKTRAKRQNRTQNKNKNGWYNHDCITLKRKLNQITKSLNRTPHKQETRILFYKTKSAYKKLLRNSKQNYEENLISKMEKLYNEDKNEFWKFLKSLKTNSRDTELPELDNLISHFQNLYTEKNTQNKINIEQNNTPNNSDTNIFDILNENISDKEVLDCMKKIKNKKTPGYDQITNEMIKCTNKEGVKLITKLFNKLLQSGLFPSEWNYGLLLPIHKGDDSTDANNYRGITLNSCLGKLFCTVLYQRLSPLLEKENIYCKEQAGFRKNMRTTDHIFLLKSIVKKYTKQNKYLYTCFVDFSKAFDSI